MVDDAIDNVDTRGRPYTKASPTTGFKDELVNNNQGGDVYHHILFMAGSILLENPVLAATLLTSDAAQVLQGRKESVTELRDDIAGTTVGIAMLKTAQTRNFNALRATLKGILCTH